MLLTGFDAPIEQVMYLDSPLKEHTLLQAIARVNRTADHKDYGLIIDYWGVSEALQEALAVFSPSDIKGAMEPKTDELPRLQTRHAVAMHFFNAVKDKGDLEQCVAVLEPEDVPTIHPREPPPPRRQIYLRRYPIPDVGELRRARAAQDEQDDGGLGVMVKLVPSHEVYFPGLGAGRWFACGLFMRRPSSPSPFWGR